MRSQWRVAAVGVLLLAWSLGAIGFVRSEGVIQASLPRLSTAPRGEHIVSDYRWGPTLRASSYYRDPGSHHHPVFLVDGQHAPSLIEKWASAPGDARPWVEISWPEARALSKVVVYHAAAFEHLPSLARYTLRCLTAAGPSTVVNVVGNREPVATHPMTCLGATALRMECHLADAEDLARVYEIEVWGR